MIWLIGFIATIFAANWSIEHYGIIGVGFGLTAPAGVLWAGLAFTFRDLTHDRYGWRGAVVAIACGALLSWWVSPAFAVASGVAFLASELSDLAVYAPLRRRHWLGAVVASNTVGVIVDSWLFLMLAFGSTAFLPGQVLAKSYMTVAAVVVLGVWRLTSRGDTGIVV